MYPRRSFSILSAAALALALVGGASVAAGNMELSPAGLPYYWRPNKLDDAKVDPIYRSLVARSSPGVRLLLEGELGGPARSSLRSLIAVGAVRRTQLARVLALPNFDKFVLEALPDLAAAQYFPGAHKLVQRMAHYHSNEMIAGALFEARIAVQLGPRVERLGAVIDGYEVDILLRGGTVVEVKYDRGSGPFLNPSLARRAGRQLERFAILGRSVMLVANKALTEDQIASFRERIGPQGRVLVSSPVGLSTQLASSYESPEAAQARLARRKLAAQSGEDALDPVDARDERVSAIRRSLLRMRRGNPVGRPSRARLAPHRPHRAGGVGHRALDDGGRALPWRPVHRVERMPGRR